MTFTNESGDPEKSRTLRFEIYKNKGAAICFHWKGKETRKRKERSDDGLNEKATGEKKQRR